MRFSLSPDILQRQPDILVGLVAVWEADNTGTRPELAEAMQRAGESLRARLQGRTLDSQPAIAAWREAFQKAGLNPKRHLPSVEALAERAVRGDPLPAINPAADIANIVSLTHLVPVGAHDLQRLPGDVEVRLSRSGDVFTPMNASQAEEVAPGEPVYATGGEVRTRRWIWRQSERAKVTPESRTILFPIDGFTGQTEEAVRQATLTLADLAKRHLRGQVAVAFVSALTPAADLGPGVALAEREILSAPPVPILPAPIEASSALPKVRPPGNSALRDWPFGALKERGLIEDMIVEEELRSDLAAGKRLTIYEGFDPTSPNLHLGHYLALRVLRWFQLHGHRVIFLIGDFTGRIGDPTDRSSARQQLTHEQVLKNAESYAEQIAHILDLGGDNPVEVKFNGAWLDPMSLRQVVELAATITVQRLIERDMFQVRLAENKPLHLHEVLYPVFQGYDSVAMGVDAELGGRDQMFNMMMGRDLARTLLGKTKHVLMTPLIPGLDGRKMSKTYGNTVDLAEDPVPMFFKLTLVNDQLLPLFLGVFTDAPEEEIAAVRRRLETEKNLQDVRERFAKEVTTLFHGPQAAERAHEEFRRVVSEGAVPTEGMREIPIDSLTTVYGPESTPGPGITDPFQGQPRVTLLSLTLDSGLVKSSSDAKRVIEQGGLRINGERTSTDPRTRLLRDRLAGALIQVGKRGYVRIVAQAR